MKIAVYPGSFDPITKGHLDVIERGARMFDGLVVSILENSTKKPFFSTEERMDMIRKATSHLSNVTVDSFGGLLVNYLKENKYGFVLRGLRALSDFEYEFQMAAMNKRLDPDIEIVFLMTDINYSYINSTMVREVIKFQGNVEEMVPPETMDTIKTKYKGEIHENHRTAQRTGKHLKRRDPCAFFIQGDGQYGGGPGDHTGDHVVVAG
ncbi:pantetheine-phosphate adenylyltransferase [Alkalibacter rhizosphaerae]|uniref:Phosphopantetheine adenylyltransferase n=1 Tax=Alkalibacter rhizosphaerae TaxID=2815577 RepID=A0A974XHF3_9FIRM|nr:pantetheine-phosphate adenylyltransferase [Alkalibacter rhizosphaerae]